MALCVVPDMCKVISIYICSDLFICWPVLIMLIIYFML